MKDVPDKQLSKVLTSDPVNSTARRVTSKGAHFDIKLKPDDTHFFRDTPKELQRMQAKIESDPCFLDLTGVTFGRFTVIGYARSARKRELTGVLVNGEQLSMIVNEGGGARWLVRCACGNYEMRKSESVKNPKNSNDACRACRQWQYLRRAEYKKRTGIWPPEDYGW